VAPGNLPGHPDLINGKALDATIPRSRPVFHVIAALAEFIA